MSSICRVIGDRERGMGTIAVGDCSVDLGVWGVVNEIVCVEFSMYDGTGAGSAHRFDLNLGGGVM